MATTTLYNEDCIERLRKTAEKSVDLIITSPPYNLGITTGGGFPSKKPGKWNGGALANGYNATHSDALPYFDYCLWQKSFLLECWRVLTDTGAIFYNHKPRIQGGILQSPLVDLNPGLPVRQLIIWQRSGGINFSPSFYLPTTEWIILFAKPGFRLKSKGASGVGDVWKIHQDRGNPHPAPFPLELPMKILETTSGQLVMDPFMGSGTTGVACIKAERDFIGVEKDESYFSLAQTRIDGARIGEFERWKQPSPESDSETREFIIPPKAHF